MQAVVDTSVNSIHFLWTAYIVVATANIATVVWLATRWSKLNKQD